MLDAGELTHIASRLRQKRPTQLERNAIASALDQMAAKLAPPPKPARSKPTSIEEAVKQAEDAPVEENASQDV